MTDIARLHREALDVTRTVPAGIRADQWSLATPDEGWDAHPQTRLLALLGRRSASARRLSGRVWPVPDPT